MFCLKTDIISLEITTGSRKHHKIKKQEGKVSTVRKYCTSCYKQNEKKFVSKVAGQKLYKNNI